MFKYLFAAAVVVASINPAWADNRAKILYTRFASAEYGLNFLAANGFPPLVGSSTYEKAIDGLVCRKTQAVVPNPVPSYDCWVKMNYTAAQAKAAYAALALGELTVVHVGAPAAGTLLKEKSAGDYFCQKFTPATAKPVVSYSCWRNLAKVK